MDKPVSVYDYYWQKKEARKKLREDKPSKENVFNRLMAMFFHREDPAEKDGKHKRTLKERKIRRTRHQSMMRNHA